MVLAIGGHVSLGDINGPAHAVMVGGRCGGSHDRHDSTFLCVHSAMAFDRSRSQDRASMPTMGRRHGIGRPHDGSHWTWLGIDRQGLGCLPCMTLSAFGSTRI